MTTTNRERRREPVDNVIHRGRGIRRLAGPSSHEQAPRIHRPRRGAADHPARPRRPRRRPPLSHGLLPQRQRRDGGPARRPGPFRRPAPPRNSAGARRMGAGRRPAGGVPGLGERASRRAARRDRDLPLPGLAGRFERPADHGAAQAVRATSTDSVRGARRPRPRSALHLRRPLLVLLLSRPAVLPRPGKSPGHARYDGDGRGRHLRGRPCAGHAARHGGTAPALADTSSRAGAGEGPGHGRTRAAAEASRRAGQAGGRDGDPRAGAQAHGPDRGGTARATRALGRRGRPGDRFRRGRRRHPRAPGPRDPGQGRSLDGGAGSPVRPAVVADAGTALRRTVRGARRSSAHPGRLGLLVHGRRAGRPGRPVAGPARRSGLHVRPTAAPGLQRRARSGGPAPLSAGGGRRRRGAAGRRRRIGGGGGGVRHRPGCHPSARPQDPPAAPGGRRRARALRPPGAERHKASPGSTRPRVPAAGRRMHEARRYGRRGSRARRHD